MEGRIATLESQVANQSNMVPRSELLALQAKVACMELTIEALQTRAPISTAVSVSSPIHPDKPPSASLDEVLCLASWDYF